MRFKVYENELPDFDQYQVTPKDEPVLIGSKRSPEEIFCSFGNRLNENKTFEPPSIVIKDAEMWASSYKNEINSSLFLNINEVARLASRAARRP